MRGDNNIGTNTLGTPKTIYTPTPKFPLDKRAESILLQSTQQRMISVVKNNLDA